MMKKKIKRIFCKEKNKKNILKHFWSKLKQEKPKEKIHETIKKLSKESNKQTSVELIFKNGYTKKSNGNVTRKDIFDNENFDVLTSENISNNHCNETNRSIEFQSPEDSLEDPMLTKITDRLLKIQADATVRKEMENVVTNILINRLVQDKTYNVEIKQENISNNTEKNSEINHIKKSSENIHDILQNKEIIKCDHANPKDIFKSEEQSMYRNGNFKFSEEQIEENENDTVNVISFVVYIKSPAVMIQVGQKNSVEMIDSKIEELEEELEAEMEEGFEKIETESEEVEAESEEIQTESDEIGEEAGEIEAESQESESEFEESEREQYVEIEFEDIEYDIENEYGDEENIIGEEDYLKASDDFKNKLIDEEKFFSKSNKRQQKPDFKDRRTDKTEIQRIENINASSIIPFITDERFLVLPNLNLTEKEKEEEERKQIEATTAMTNAYRLLPAIYRMGIQLENDIEDVEFEKVVIEKSSESPGSSETISVFINEKDIFKYPSTPAILRMGSSTERSESDFSENLEGTKTKDKKRRKSSTKENSSVSHYEESIEDSFQTVIWNLPKLEWIPTILHIMPPNIIFTKIVYFVQEYFLIIDDLSEQIVTLPPDSKNLKKSLIKHPSYVYDTVETPSEIGLGEEAKEMPYSSIGTGQTSMTIRSPKSFHTPIKIKTECPKSTFEIKHEYYDRDFLIPDELSKSRVALSKTNLNNFGKRTKQMESIENKFVKENLKKPSYIMNEIVCKNRDQRISKERKFAGHQISSSTSSKHIPWKRIYESEESVIKTYQGKDDDEIIFGKIYDFEESSESLSGNLDSEIFYKTFKTNIRTGRESSSDHSGSEISLYKEQEILQYHSDILIRNNKAITEIEQRSLEYYQDSEMYNTKNINTCTDFKQKCQKKDIEYMRMKQTTYSNFSKNWQAYMFPKPQHSIFYINNEIIDILDDTLLVSSNDNHHSDRRE